METIPELPSDLSPEEAWHMEQRAENRLNRAEADRLAQIKALEASTKALADNSDFKAFVLDYFGGDVQNKLEQLRKCPAEDLAIARQRWMDAENMYNDLLKIIEPATVG